MRTPFKTLLLLVIFSIAMGFLETAVVIYLRDIYYPEGFHLPLKFIDPHTAVIELLREAATLIMLITIAMLAGKSRIQRFAFFLLSFAIWDMVYYIFLKVFLNWPSSIFEGDVLFLIPMPWIGPVLAPCLLSLTMILVAMVLLYKEDTFINDRIGWSNISLMITGSCVVIFSFIMHYKDYVQLDLHGPPVNTSHVLTYNWWVFVAGELLVLIPTLFMVIRKPSQLS